MHSSHIVCLSVSHITIRRLGQNMHPEKCFVESKKIWLVQQCFSFKYGPMKILFEFTKKILLIFFAFPRKKSCYDSKKHGIAN